MCFINREILGRSDIVRDSWLFQSRGWSGERNLPRDDIPSVTGMFMQFSASFVSAANLTGLVYEEKPLRCKKAHLVTCCPSFPVFIFVL